MAPRGGRARRAGGLNALPAGTPAGLRRRALLAAPLAALAGTGPAAATPLRIRATPLPLAEDGETPARLGRLRPLGALALAADHPAFGGFSGLALDPDLTLHAVSDRGWGLEARLVRDAAGAPAALTAARLFPLRDAAGRPLDGAAGDAEALARLPKGGFLVGFERRHRIARHAALDQPGRPFPAPPGLAAAPANAGLEALAVLADGRVVAIAEGLPGPAPGTVAAWIGAADGRAWRGLAYRPAAGFAPVDAAALPDGGLVVLERRFAWIGGFTCRIVRLDPPALAAPVLRGVELAQLAPPLPIDNFEAIALAPDPAGLLLALLSDDNFSPWQRTILFLLRLD